MNRYAIENLFGIEGLNIAWYGLIIACGMVLGFALAIYRCRKTGINKEHIYNLALWLIPVCIICARAYYVIFKWDNYKNDLISVFTEIYCLLFRTDGRRHCRINHFAVTVTPATLIKNQNFF